MVYGHQAVMLEPVLTALNVQADGIYLDATFGRGGHTAAILAKLGAQGRVYALDQDLTAVEFAQQRFSAEPRFTIAHGSFAQLAQHCVAWGIAGRINGILLDLGVSSGQLDDPARGFSFRYNSPLDMRMNCSTGITAAEWLAEADEQDIASVLWRYGEERHARRIARQIVTQRAEQPLRSTQDLVNVVIAASPRVERHKHPATRVFQAIRLFINQELTSLEAVLPQAVEQLARQGRLVVLSFHSLEDRLVKQFLREQAQGKSLPRHLPLPVADLPSAVIRLVGKAQKPDAAEVVANPRARSAILRVAEKC